MLVRGNGQSRRENRALAPWRRWVQTWREDHEQHAAARARARAHAPLRPGERLLAVACSAGSELLVATDWALYHQAGQSWARLGWDQVGRVDWDEQRRVLMLAGLTPAVPARTMLHLAKCWDLPAVAAERASWAKVVDQRISLNGEAGARVIARRVPGGPQVRWLVVLDQGLDAADGPGRTAGCDRGRIWCGRRTSDWAAVVRPCYGRAEGVRPVGPEREIAGCDAIKMRRRASYLDVKSRGC